MTVLVPEKRRSALELFGKCQFAWHQLYVLGVMNQSPEARRGTSIHAAIKHYIRRLFETRQTEDLALATEAFRLGLVESPVPPEMFDDVHDLFWSFVENFRLDVDAYLLHEVRPEDPDDYKLQIDLAYARGDVLELWDWKSHYRVFPQRRAQAEFQPRFYLARARRIWPGFTRYRFVFFFLRFGVSVVVEYDASDLDRFDEHVLSLEAAQLEAMAGGQYPATAGDHCGFCALECPLAADATRAPVRVVTVEDRDRLAGEYLALLQAVAARRRALEAECTVNGPFEFGDVEFGHKQSETNKYPAAKVVDVLRKHEVEPTFSVGKTAIGSYLKAKKWAHVRGDLEALAQTTPRSTFGVSRTVVDGRSDDESEEE